MATFEYEALTPAGRLMTGMIEADSPEEASISLAALGLQVQNVAKGKPIGPKTRIGRSEFLMFNEQLAAITASGIPLERSLREMAREVASGRLRKLIDAVATDLENGRSISETFDSRRGHFPPLYGRIVEAGVKTGRLSEMLLSLNRHLITARRTRRLMVEALAYPTVVLFLAAAMLTVIFLTVIPQFREIFDGFDAELPMITEIYLGLAEHVVLVWLIIAGVAGILIAGGLVLRRLPGGRRMLEKALIGLPVIGRVHLAIARARLAEAMATLVAAGCDLPECLRQGAIASGSANILSESDELAKRLEGGESLVGLSPAGSYVPGFFLYSMHLGAQRNELSDNLHGLGEMYAGQASAHQGRTRAFLAPILLVVVGIVIGLGVMAMFAPLPGLINSMQY